MKTHWKKLQNPDYFGAWSLPEGDDLVLTIDFVRTEEVTGQGGRKEQLPVLHFKENEKPLVLNVTNSRTIESVHGSPYVEDWDGKQIQLYKDYTQLKGEEVDCVRIRSIDPDRNKEAFTPKHENWEKAIQNIANQNGTIKGIKKHFSLSEKHEALLKEEVQALIEQMEGEKQLEEA